MVDTSVLSFMVNVCPKIIVYIVSIHSKFVVSIGCKHFFRVHDKNENYVHGKYIVSSRVASLVSL